MAGKWYNVDSNPAPSLSKAGTFIPLDTSKGRPKPRIRGSGHAVWKTQAQDTCLPEEQQKQHHSNFLCWSRKLIIIAEVYELCYCICSSQRENNAPKLRALVLLVTNYLQHPPQLIVTCMPSVVLKEADCIRSRFLVPPHRLGSSRSGMGLRKLHFQKVSPGPF